MKTLRAEAWTTNAKTTVVMDDETTITGKRVVAECDTEAHAALFAAAKELLKALQNIEEAAIDDPRCMPNSPTWIAIDKSRQFIAKATGATP